MISKEEVKRVAGLARLGLSDEEIEKFRKDLSSILDYINQLKELDVSGVEPTTHSVFLENILREDEPGKPDSERAGRLLSAAPANQERYVKVKAIF